ncbi:MAG: zinc ABC transporter substrate-binding protein [bacterium]|nr:zinc ABC transporter substrate-binding protein [bacterium]
MKKILFATFVIILVAAGGLWAFLWSEQNQKSDNGKITVVATLFPLYDFIQNIGRDKIEVTLLLPPGVEPHTFEPKPTDIAKINRADVFVYTGKFMEPWAQDIITGLANKKTTVVNASDNISLTPGLFHDQDEPPGSLDPHVWLDFDNVKIIVDNVTNGLIKRDPDHAAFYSANANAYKEQITRLDNDYGIALALCQNKKIIYGGHYAFGYLARRYKLEYIAAQGVSPDAEPTAQDLINLVEQIKRDKIKYIFYEELTSPKIAQTVAKETGAQMILLNAAHNLSKKDLTAKVGFISIMRNNLNNLKIGLRCGN